MFKILASAYDVDPFKGSESGSGWNFILQASKSNKVLAFTRKNNRESIEKYIIERNVDVSNVSFHYFDLPPWAIFWKRGERFSKLYFYLWQFSLPIYIYFKDYEFDLAHNINFHTDTVPTFLWMLGKPTIWGPINHNEFLRKDFTSLGYYLKDRFKWILRLLSWKLDPFHFLSRRYVSLVIGSHSSVKKRLGIPSEKFYQLTTIASEEPLTKKICQEKNLFNIAVIGRQIPIKLIDLSILIFNDFFLKLNTSDRKKIRLHILGSGEMNSKLKTLANKLDCSDSIVFIPWISHDEMGKFYMNMDCLLNCSHEGGGAIVAESLSYGLPILCFSEFGAGEAINESCGRKVEVSTKKKSIKNFSKHLMEFYTNPEYIKDLSDGAIKFHKKNLSWDSKAEKLNNIYNKLMERSKNV
jgi:glycosyltransferase involved in cell wall biosynthesis